jgi:hypothetical protein
MNRAGDTRGTIACCTAGLEAAAVDAEPDHHANSAQAHLP